MDAQVTREPKTRMMALIAGICALEGMRRNFVNRGEADNADQCNEHMNVLSQMLQEQTDRRT